MSVSYVLGIFSDRVKNMLYGKTLSQKDFYAYSVILLKYTARILYIDRVQRAVGGLVTDLIMSTG